MKWNCEYRNITRNSPIKKYIILCVAQIVQLEIISNNFICIWQSQNLCEANKNLKNN